MRYADCHIHVMDYIQPDPVLSFASAQGMMLFSVSTNAKTAERGLEQRERFHNTLKLFVGIHPSEATIESQPEVISKFAKRADGIGEIGLDPRYSEVSEKSTQMRVFLDQLRLAETSRKPVQVHTRDAEGTCIGSLASYELPRVLLHWFEGEPLLNEAAGRGYYVSVGPALLYSKILARIAKAYPLDLLLTESDGPVSFRALGDAGGPYLVPSVVFRLSEILRMDYLDLSAKLVKNAETFLFRAKG